MSNSLSRTMEGMCNVGAGGIVPPEYLQPDAATRLAAQRAWDGGELDGGYYGDDTTTCQETVGERGPSLMLSVIRHAAASRAEADKESAGFDRELPGYENTHSHLALPHSNHSNLSFLRPPHPSQLSHPLSAYPSTSPLAPPHAGTSSESNQHCHHSRRFRSLFPSSLPRPFPPPLPAPLSFPPPPSSSHPPLSFPPPPSSLPPIRSSSSDPPSRLLHIDHSGLVLPPAADVKPLAAAADVTRPSFQPLSLPSSAPPAFPSNSQASDPSNTPIRRPIDPSHTPINPICTPVHPISTPIYPISTPVNPADTVRISTPTVPLSATTPMTHCGSTPSRDLSTITNPLSAGHPPPLNLSSPPVPRSLSHPPSNQQNQQQQEKQQPQQLQQNYLLQSQQQHYHHHHQQHQPHQQHQQHHHYTNRHDQQQQQHKDERCQLQHQAPWQSMPMLYPGSQNGQDEEFELPEPVLLDGFHLQEIVLEDGSYFFTPPREAHFPQHKLSPFKDRFSSKIVQETPNAGDPMDTDPSTAIEANSSQECACKR
ncbi:hypothetical protein CLOM_g17951 [Closterium sp. NIES-68]|nr:hypothetical protein CLOM_g17951 [Closterium sp. NIES-68]